MNKTYCGACHGERGCPECEKAAKTAVYTGLTDFFPPEAVQGSADLTMELHKNSSEENRENTLLFAADLGTTTLAFVCEDGEGRVSYGAENPQRSVAADVIGRVDAAMQGKGEQLQTMIREALAKGFLFVLEMLCKERNIRPEELLTGEVRILMAGNTVMQHLLLGYPVEGFAKAPFRAFKTEKVEISCRELFGECASYRTFPNRLKEATVTVFPCFSPFVGGDVAAGIYALAPRAVRKETTEVYIPVKSGWPEDSKKGTCLLLDLGTNGELLLWNGKRLLGTAAAMGSAFEGGRFAYASELFRLVAKALRQGAADETGLLCEPYFSEGFEGLWQEDIREFQLAKGALRAGIEVLGRKAGIFPAEIERVYVAGGIGTFCDCKDMFKTGLLPKEFAGKVSFVGNSCMGGLLQYGKAGEPELDAGGEIINLAEQPEFELLFYRYMNFEAMTGDEVRKGEADAETQ